MARWVLVLVMWLVVLTGVGAAAEWGGIEPGVSTLEEVRERYGNPSRESKATVEGYDTTQWVYEGTRAPPGLIRMVVDFGLLTPQGYKPSRVRVFRLEPKRLIFGRKTVIQGWGVPDREGSDGGVTRFFYADGLVVVFDKEGQNAEVLDFMMPQPLPAPASEPGTR